MRTIALIAVNADSQEHEKNLKEFVHKQLAEHDIKVLNFESHHISDMGKEAKEKAEKTFIVFDAKEGMNPTFAFAAAELCKQNVKPTLIISNIDAEDADVEHAKNALAEIWAIENPELETWDLNFDKLYFSYDKMGFHTEPEIAETGVEVLIDTIVRK